MVLLDLGSSPTLLSIRLLVALSKPGRAHQGVYYPGSAQRAHQHTGSALIVCSGFRLDHNTLFGGPGGNRTLVQNTFHFTSYSNKLHRNRRGVWVLRLDHASFTATTFRQIEPEPPGVYPRTA